MVKVSKTLRRSDDKIKMRIPSVIMFYTAGNSGTDAIHREKCHVDFDDEALSLSKKKLEEEVGPK